MSETITLELPDTLARQAREVAAISRRQIEDVLTEWIEQSANEIPVELLSNEDVLALCDMRMAPEQQEILDELMIRNREGQISETERRQLDELMRVYRRGLVRKARAWKVAVERKLKTASELRG